MGLHKLFLTGPINIGNQFATHLSKDLRKVSETGILVPVPQFFVLNLEACCLIGFVLNF